MSDDFDSKVSPEIRSQKNFYRDLARDMTARADRASLFLDVFAELVAAGMSVMVPDDQIPESGLFTITAKARHVREFNRAMRNALDADKPEKVDALLSRLQAAEADARKFRDIRKLLGYVEDGSAQTVDICQDDATGWWCVRAGGKSYRGPALRTAIDRAIEALTSTQEKT